VVVGDGVVAGSQYAALGSRYVEPCCPGEVRVFAEAMLAEVRWRPDPIFMMDIAESGGRLWLVQFSVHSFQFTVAWWLGGWVVGWLTAIRPEGRPPSPCAANDPTT
jgi:hypothetical protein